MPAKPHGDKPPPVVLDLDTLAREGAPVTPFVFKLGGQRFTALDSQEVDWQILMQAGRDPRLFFEHVIPREQHAAFFGQELAGWRMEALLAAYNKHYGLPNPGEFVASSRP